MADPNLRNVNTLFSLAVDANLTTVVSNVLVNYSQSNVLYKVNSILLINDSTLPTNVFVTLNPSGSAFLHPIASPRFVPGNNVTYLLRKTDDLILAEGDFITANTDTNVGLDLKLFYEDISEVNRLSVDFLTIGGGGGAGGGPGGGGGAGGFLTGSSALFRGSNYNITIGAGGSGCSGGPTYANYGGNGTPTSLCGLSICYVAFGGGGGASTVGWQQPSSETCRIGFAGASGGGGVGLENGSVSFGPSFTFPIGVAQGNPGGGGCSISGSGTWGGGGGGASESGEPGRNPTTAAGGRGGNGRISCLTGIEVFYAGGGGGGTHAGPGGIGGRGGGGFGNNAAGSGGVNLGGGGGGCGYGTGFPGGSGVVIIRYAGSQKALGGNVTNVSGYTVHTFNSSGNLIIL